MSAESKRHMLNELVNQHFSKGSDGLVVPVTKKEILNTIMFDGRSNVQPKPEAGVMDKIMAELLFLRLANGGMHYKEKDKDLIVASKAKDPDYHSNLWVWAVEAGKDASGNPMYKIEYMKSE